MPVADSVNKTFGGSERARNNAEGLWNVMDPAGVTDDLFGWEDDNPPTGFVGRNGPPGRGDPALDQKFTRARNLIALYERMGRPISPWLRHYANTAARRGGQSGEGDLIDFNSGSLPLSQAQSLIGLEQRDKQWRTRPGLFNKRLDLLRAENIQRERQDYWNEHGEPAFDQAQGVLSEMAGKPTFSAGQIGEQKARIASIIRGAQENRLRTGAATLGLRGLDASSPAGAAVLARMQAESEETLSRELTDYTSMTDQTNRENSIRDNQLLAELATRRAAAREGIYNQGQIFDLSGEISGLMEAIRSQKESEQLQRDLARDAAAEARKANYVRYGTAALGVVAAPFTGGASLGLTGAALGGG